MWSAIVIFKGKIIFGLLIVWFVLIRRGMTIVAGNEIVWHFSIKTVPMQFWYELQILNLSTFSFFQIRQIQAPIWRPLPPIWSQTLKLLYFRVISNFIISEMSDIRPDKNFYGCFFFQKFSHFSKLIRLKTITKISGTVPGAKKIRETVTVIKFLKLKVFENFRHFRCLALRNCEKFKTLKEYLN